MKLVYRKWLLIVYIVLIKSKLDIVYFMKLHIYTSLIISNYCIQFIIKIIIIIILFNKYVIDRKKNNQRFIIKIIKAAVHVVL